MNTPHDQDFDALLKEYEAEFERYQKLPSAEPARELDIAIMAKAREAVAKPKPKRSRWLVPLASVASLALAAGIGWRTYQGERRDQAVAIEQSAAAKADEVIVEFEWIDLPNRDAERKEMANSPPLPPAAPMVAPSAAAPPPPPPPPPAEPKSIAETATAQPTDALADAASAAASDDGPSVAGTARAERAFAEPHVAADHAVMAEPPESSKHIGVSGGAVAAPGQASAEEASSLNKQDAKPKKILEPEEWIEQIRGLKSVRRFHEVKKELAEFKKTYPNYPLPSDLEKPRR